MEQLLLGSDRVVAGGAAGSVATVTTSRFEYLVEKDKDLCAGLHHVPLFAVDSKPTKLYSEVQDAKGKIAVFSGVSFMAAGGAVDRRNVIAVYAKSLRQ